MKNLTTKLFLTLAVVCVGGSTLSAQSYKVTADIPFAFHAGKSSLPAGKYMAEKPFETTIQSLISASGHRVAVASMFSLSETQGQPRLVFHHYGNEYFLSQIWTGLGTGTRLEPTAAERMLKETMAANHADEVTVIMAGLR